jgi:hypothetical protein
MTSRRQDTHTVLTGLLDRSALYGALATIETLGLDLLEIRQVGPNPEPPEQSQTHPCTGAAG